MNLIVVILAICVPAVLFLLGLSVRWLTINPRGDVETGLVWRSMRVYCRVMHRVQYDGLEHLPRWVPGEPPIGPLVIVANHSAGIDPLLIQSAARFEITWMMMKKMMVPWASRLWEWTGVIGVGPKDSAAARQAINVLKRGGVVGIFPEGTIVRPPRQIMPFEPGVGLIIHRTGARVLMAIIEGTPDNASAYASLLTRSRSRVRFLPVVDGASLGANATEIAQGLQSRMQRETGWLVREPAPELETDPAEVNLGKV